MYGGFGLVRSYLAGCMPITLAFYVTSNMEFDLLRVFSPFQGGFGLRICLENSCIFPIVCR